MLLVLTRTGYTYAMLVDLLLWCVEVLSWCRRLIPIDEIMREAFARNRHPCKSILSEREVISERTLSAKDNVWGGGRRKKDSLGPLHFGDEGQLEEEDVPTHAQLGHAAS